MDIISAARAVYREFVIYRIYRPMGPMGPRARPQTAYIYIYIYGRGGVPSPPLDAHRKVSIDAESFRLNYGTRGELCPKPFGNMMNLVILWIPQHSVDSTK